MTATQMIKHLRTEHNGDKTTWHFDGYSDSMQIELDTSRKHPVLIYFGDDRRHTWKAADCLAETSAAQESLAGLDVFDVEGWPLSTHPVVHNYLGHIVDDIPDVERNLRALVLAFRAEDVTESQDYKRFFGVGASIHVYGHVDCTEMYPSSGLVTLNTYAPGGSVYTIDATIDGHEPIKTIARWRMYDICTEAFDIHVSSTRKNNDGYFWHHVTQHHSPEMLHMRLE